MQLDSHSRLLLVYRCFRPTMGSDRMSLVRRVWNASFFPDATDIALIKRRHNEKCREGHPISAITIESRKFIVEVSNLEIFIDQDAGKRIRSKHKLFEYLVRSSRASPQTFIPLVISSAKPKNYSTYSMRILVSAEQHYPRFIDVFEAEIRTKGVLVIGEGAKILGPNQHGQDILIIAEYLRVKRFRLVLTILHLRSVEV